MRFRPTVIITVIFLISNVTCDSGNDEALEEKSTVVETPQDGIEEVSIEAVDDDDLQSMSFRNVPEYEEAEGNVQSGAGEAPPADNFTAVATVYPDFGQMPSSNSSLLNITNVANSTKSRPRIKVSCSQLYPEDSNSTEVGTVEITNMTYLLHGLLVSNPTVKIRTTPSNCTVVLFYTYWCPWSAKAAPHYNALPRAFRNIRFAAIDSSVHTAINTYFGILSVPSVVLFYNGKLFAKFNETTFNVNQLADFVSLFTDQKPGIRLNVTSADFVGPIPSSITKGHDWYLLLSWTFIVSCFVYYVSKTAIWHRVLELMQNSWREAEAVASVPPPHFHQD